MGDNKTWLQDEAGIFSPNWPAPGPEPLHSVYYYSKSPQVEVQPSANENRIAESCAYVFGRLEGIHCSPKL
jgi:hypothetical protein